MWAHARLVTHLISLVFPSECFPSLSFPWYDILLFRLCSSSLYSFSACMCVVFSRVLHFVCNALYVHSLPKKTAVIFLPPPRMQKMGEAPKAFFVESHNMNEMRSVKEASFYA